MIICISGPSSTGKTTLFNKLKDHKKMISVLYGQEVIFKEEYIRDMVNNYDKTLEEITNDPDLSIDFQCDLAKQIYFIYEDMLSNQDKLYICDRSPLDNVVYDLMNYASDNSDVMIRHKDQLSNACSLMRSIYSFVDRVYLTQVDISNNDKVNDDGFRPSAYNSRRQLEIELFNTIFDFSDKVIKLPSNTNDRINIILTDFSKLLRKEYN